MIDNRLIDYSKDYKGYKECLQDLGKSITKQDLMIVIESYLEENLTPDFLLSVTDSIKQIGRIEA